MLEARENPDLALEAREGVATRTARIVAGEDFHRDVLASDRIGALDDAGGSRRCYFADDLVPPEEPTANAVPCSSRRHGRSLRLGARWRGFLRRATERGELGLCFDARTREPERLERADGGGSRRGVARARSEGPSAALERPLPSFRTEPGDRRVRGECRRGRRAEP